MGMQYYEHHGVTLIEVGQKCTNGIISGEIIEINEDTLILESLFSVAEREYNIKEFVEKFELIEEKNNENNMP